MTQSKPIVHDLFGIPIYAFTMDQALDASERAIASREPLLIGVVNAAKIVNMRRDPGLSDAVLTANMILADGMSVVWASRLLGKRLPERVAGIDLMIRLLERANQHGYRVFCLGATDEVLKTVAEVIARDYPNAKLVGVQNGYYSADEEAAVAERIGAAKPDMLFVAMTSPKKEVFLSCWSQRMQVPVCHGVGGAFDVVAGKVRRAPRIWQALGMEWLYRVLQEPGRLWKRYLVTNSAFCRLILREMGRRLVGRGSTGSGNPVSIAIGDDLVVAKPQIRPSVDTVLRAEVIRSVDELQSLRPEWNTLVAGSAADSIFLTWEWIDSWLKSVKKTPRLLSFALRDSSGKLAAVAPFYLTKLKFSGTVGFRCLRVLGDRDSGSEYPDLVVRDGLEAPANAALARILRENRRDWDCIWLPQVAGWSGAPDRFSTLAGQAHLRLNQRGVDFGSLTLPSDYDAYLSSLSSNQRSNIRRSVRRAEAAGRIEFVQCDAASQLAELLPVLFELHQQRWEAAGLPGSFQAGSVLRRFCGIFSPLALQNGWLRLFALKLDGRYVAVQYGYAYAGRFYQLQEGYDPAAPEGIGNVLRDHVFRRCIEEGLTEYDFLGEFTEHKRRWGAQQRFGYDLFCGRRSVKNRLLFTRPIWPTGRYLRETGGGWAEPSSVTIAEGVSTTNHSALAAASPK